VIFVMARTVCCRTCVLLFVLCLSLGCGGGGKKWAANDQVEGTLKIDGAPLPNVMVEFVPDLDPQIQAPISRGYTDEAGHFKLAFENDKPGAVIGKHNVLIRQGRSASPGEEDRDPQKAAAKGPRVPAVYANPLQTPLQIEVTADKHDYPLTLSQSPRKRS
jgi:hypothetical protein